MKFFYIYKQLYFLLEIITTFIFILVLKKGVLFSFNFIDIALISFFII